MVDAMDEQPYPFFFRGAVEVGRFSIWDGLVFGEAYIEAHECQEKAQWIGVHTGRQATSLLNESREDPEQAQSFVPYDIPLKGQKTQGSFALPWPDLVKDRQLFREILRKQIQRYEPGNIRAKYENTLDFAKWCWPTDDEDQPEGEVP
jgi:hypothetical protein